jgi:hypothetical protein
VKVNKQEQDREDRGNCEMTTYKGIVKANVVVSPEGARLPNGLEVEVRLLEPSFRRDDAFAEVRANRITRDVGMAQIIEEDKQEREKHPDTWLKA